MQSRLKAAIGLVFLFFLISSGLEAAAEGGDQSIYLPLIVRPSNWQEVGAGSASGGGISNNGGWSSAPSLAIAPDGTPYMAWVDDSGGNHEIYVRKWNGSSWVPVGAGSASGGGISNNIGWSLAQSLVIAPDGTPYLAWQDDINQTTYTEIYIRTWNGSSWVEVGAGSATSGGISNNYQPSNSPSLAVAPDGTLYAAWSNAHGPSNADIYVLLWNGSSWVEVGTGSADGWGISNNSEPSYRPSMVIAPDGTPYVAWEDYSSGGNGEIYVRTWDGSSWVEVGAGSASGGGISNNSGTSWTPSLAIAPDGTLYVAWYDDSSGNHNIYVRTWDGNSWVEVGAGSANGGGISNNSGSSYSPSIMVAPDGMLYVAWSNYLDEIEEIFVKTWNGSNWEEVDLGSASGGGISNNYGDSSSPSLGIAPDGTPYVAWEDGSNGVVSEIYIKRHSE